MRLAVIGAVTVVEGNVHEHIARAMYYFSVHLLYASIVGSAAWVLTSIRPRQRHHEVLDLGCVGIQLCRTGRCINR